MASDGVDDEDRAAADADENCDRVGAGGGATEESDERLSGR